MNSFKGKGGLLAILVLCTAFGAAVLYKTRVLHYHPRMVIPVFAYRVSLEMYMEGHGGPVRIKTFLPESDGRQSISEVDPDPGIFSYSSVVDDGGRAAVFTAGAAASRQEVSLSFLVKSKTAHYILPDSLSIPTPSAEQSPWLQATDLIQKDDPAVEALAERLGISESRNAVDIVRRVYHYAADSIKSAGFSARTDAVLTLRLGEASCNGKSRLMTALLRYCGIPARLVGGIIMEPGAKQTTHQWVEVLLGGQWVPFCPLNHHYASIPDRYLSLYRGDYPMFTRTANINFRYAYNMKKLMLPRETKAAAAGHSWFNVLNLWDMFRKAGISLELLKVLLMIPLGAVVIIIFRNVIGVHTFGTFLPVLIATSYREMGLWWGHLVFAVVILIGACVRFFLERFRLLHSPKLTIILVSVITTLILITVVGIKTGNTSLFSASMFPLAIMAITIERFSIVTESEGLAKAFRVFFWTVVVVTFCYLSMLSVFLQSVVMAFPETLLLIVAASIYLGSWNKLRLFEFIRFRKLIFGRQTPGGEE